MDALSPHTADADLSRAPKLKVFISYSRDDLQFADQLDAALDLCNFESVLDRHGISGGEEWKQRLGSLIRDADTVVFVLSPASARSEICKWEVDEALRLGKRLLPVLCRELGGASPPPQLQERNYIYFYFEPHAPGSGFGTGLAQLVTALQTDLAWIREHTRLLARATEWEIGGRPANRLLSGSDIADAKDWAARRPKDAPPPTNLHLDYIKVSEEQETARSSAQRQQLEMVALAQEERAKALAAAEEAVARAADLQVKRARLRNFALIAMTAAAVLVGWLYLRADAQRHVAEEQTALAKEHKALAENRKASAEAMLHTTTSLIVEMSQKFTFNSAEYEKVRLVFERGVEEGDSTSMGNLGLIYKNGWGVEHDYIKARELFEKGAALNDAYAMFSIGVLYADGLGVPQDYAKAREWYEKAAAGDNTFALENLGVLYAKGLGVTQDYGKSREWYEKAAALDSTSAMSKLAELYAEGRGVPKDYAKAREWYQKAVAKGSASAMNSIGALYARGSEGEVNIGLAIEWYEKAVANGNIDSMYNLGLIYEDERNQKHDYAKAREWYEKGANAGDSDAMNKLAAIYSNGKGVPRDYAKAGEWYEKAAAKGNSSAKSHLRKLPIEEAVAGGHYDVALKLRVSLAEEVEQDETKRTGAPGKETAGELVSVAWAALFARDFAKALAVSERAHQLTPDDLMIETNRAHALMFLGRTGEARALYLNNRGKPTSVDGGKIWNAAITDDFAEMRKAGITHPMMAEIEKQLTSRR